MNLRSKIENTNTFKSLNPVQRTMTLAKTNIKHIEFEKLIAIQEYLLDHGANDETINDKIRELKVNQNAN